MSLTPRIDSLERNKIINGGMDFWQRRITGNFAAAVSGFVADRAQVTNQGATTKEFSVARSTDVPTLAQAGSQAVYSQLTTVVVDSATLPDAADLVGFYGYRIEGYDYADMHGKEITIGFWFKASLTGSYSLCLNGKSDFSRNYSTSFSVPVANTWQYVSKTIQLENVSGYNFQDLNGLEIAIGALAGSTYSTSTQNAWQAGPKYSVSGSANWIGTPGATIRIAMISCVIGTGASAMSFTRAGKNINEELALCQRYCETISGRIGSGEAHNSETITGSIFRVSKRTIPTFSFIGSIFVNDGATQTAATGLALISTLTSKDGFALTSTNLFTVGRGVTSYTDTPFESNYAVFSSEI